MRTAVDWSQHIMAALLRLPKRKGYYVYKQKREWYCSAEDHPVYGMLKLWEIVLCSQSHGQLHSGLVDLGGVDPCPQRDWRHCLEPNHVAQPLSPIFYAARKGNYDMVVSFLSIIVLSQIVRYLDESNDSTSSLNFVRLRCRAEGALSFRQWLEELCVRRKRKQAEGPPVDCDSLFTVLAKSRTRALAKINPCRFKRAQKSLNIKSCKFTVGDLIREVHKMIRGERNDAALLREQILRAMDSLESRINPERAPSVPTQRRFRKVATTKQRRPVYEYDSGCDQDILDEDRDDEFTIEEHDYGGGQAMFDKDQRDEFASKGQGSISDGFDDSNHFLQKNCLLPTTNMPADSCVDSMHALTAEDRRTEEVLDDVESLRSVSDCDGELAVYDFTTSSWVVDGSQYMAAMEEGSPRQEWDTFSIVSSDMDEMPFQSVAAPDGVVQPTRPSYSQVLQSGPMPVAIPMSELKVIQATPTKNNAPHKQTPAAADVSDRGDLLFDAESIRDGAKWVGHRRPRLHAIHHRRATIDVAL
jgi:hypothetical protein